MISISILVLIVALALPLFKRNIYSLLYSRLTSIILIYASAISFNALYIQPIGSGIGTYSGLFHITQISQLFDSFICSIAALILVGWPIIKRDITYIGNNEEEIRISNLISIHNYPTEYSILALISILGGILLVSSADLISLYLSIELQSYGVYIITSLFRNSESSIAAGLKYFLLGGFASCLILLGCAFIYVFSGLTQLESIYNVVNVSEETSITLGLTLGIVFLFIGFLFKIAAAPLHNWAPDVYDGTPTIVTIWLTIMPKISILIFLLELQTQLGLIDISQIGMMTNTEDLINKLNFSTSYILTNLILISSLLSLLLGTVVGLAQIKMKRLLAYSTISHIGFILLALAINTEQSVESFLFYIIQYSMTNLNVFLILIAFGLLIHNTFNKPMQNVHLLEAEGSENDISQISELQGQFFVNPLLSLSFTICLFSMAGIPPLLGFFSKQFVLYSAIQKGFYFMSIVAIIVSVISASYYLKIITILFTKEENKSHYYRISKNEGELINSTHGFLISTLTLFILLFILKPSIILNSTTLLSLSLFYY